MSLIQIRNFDSVFQLQFFIVNLSAALTFLTFTVYRKKHLENENTLAITWLTLSICCSIIAACNMGNGLFVPIILVFAVFFFGNWKQHALMTILACVLTWIIYFRGYEMDEKRALNLADPMFYWDCMLYAIYFIGNSFNLGGKNISVFLLAFFGLPLGIFYTFQVIFDKSKRTETKIFSVLVIIFVFLSIASAAAGRIQFGSKQALTTRYCSTTIMYWGALLGILFSLPKGKKTAVFFHIASIVGILVISVTIYRQILVLGYCSSEGEKRNVAEVSLLAGFTDMGLISSNLHSYERKTIEILRKRNLSIFSTSSKSPYTKSLNLEKLPDSEIEFDLLGVREYMGDYLGRPGLVLYGGVKNSDISKKPILITSPSGNIKGIGTRVRSLNLIPDIYEEEAYKTYWTAYYVGSLSELTESNVVSTNKIIPRKSKHSLNLQHFKGIEVTVLLEKETSFTPQEATLDLHGDWFEDGFYPGLGIEEPPSKMIGTWNTENGDENTGKMLIKLEKLPISRDTGNVYLPVLFGPEKNKCSIQILGSSAELTSKVFLEHIPSHKWCYLDLTRFINNGEIGIVVEDSGTGWGQWMAIALPVLKTE